RAAQNYDLAALGFNCGREIRMEDLARMARTLGPGIRMGFVRPNAGTPTKVEGRWQYPHTAAAMAEALPTLFERGVRMIGGCCGTTPEHIAAFQPIVEAWNARH